MVYPIHKIRPFSQAHNDFSYKQVSQLLYIYLPAYVVLHV